MAELATIARPYAEALFKAVGSGDASGALGQMQALAAVAGNADMLRFADNPKVSAEQIVSVITGVAKTSLDAKVGNLLRTVVDNGRLPALPEIAAQFNALVKARSGTSDAVIESAYPIEGPQLAELVATLEKRFGRKLAARVSVEPSLIGGVRVVVGDEVLDTSVKARLEKMKLALTA
ncbi:MAG: F0F1 ATP synthase subunit delta [Burkholderiaceae bacterium]